jgi:phospholipase/carboxylesterase
MHGLGATNHDFDDLVPELGLDGLRYVFPQAPSRRVTINGGARMPAWYDILSLEDPPLRESEADVRETEGQLRLLIDRERARGIPSHRIFLAGFSQGGAVALHSALRYSEPLAGALILSAYLLLPQAFENECHASNRHLPLLFCHGQSDGVVPMALGRLAFERTASAGYAAEWHTFPMGHSVCFEEVLVIRDWLKLRLGEP